VIIRGRHDVHQVPVVSCLPWTKTRPCNMAPRLAFRDAVVPSSRIRSDTAGWAVSEGAAGLTPAGHLLRIGTDSSVVCGEGRVL
jgi:hypothetical protein